MQVPDPFAQLQRGLADRYRVERLLGTGGMATVYRARDLRHDRDVAIKVLRPDIAATVGPERFEREIAITASLTHPGILPLLDSGTTDGLLWYAMPCFTGRTLRDRLGEQGPLPLPEALALFRDIAGALAFAHAHQVLHRDLKPTNILLQDGRAVLADFGIALPLGPRTARLTESGLSVGTPEYMSPEQVMAEQHLDARSDVYALGCVLFEMLAGEPPFIGATPQSVMAKRLRDPVPSLTTLRDVPRALEAAVHQALAREPADRFASVAAFARAVEASGEERSPPRRWGRAGLVTAAVLGLLAVTGILLRRPGRASRADAGFDRGVVAILPARVTTSGHDLEYLREGFLDLVAARLTGEGGPRAADPRATLAALRSLGDQADAGDLARRLGAGRVLDASIIGDHRHLTLSAALLAFPAGTRQPPVTVEGPEDSLGVLVDQLMIKVLALQAGLDANALTRVKSLPAWRAYLAGKAAYRSGRYEQATNAFSQALAADSTFTLAALADIAARVRSGGDPAARLAQVARSIGRLGPADSLWFRVLAGPRYPASSRLRDQLGSIDSATARLSDRPDVWFELGDLQLHAGATVDLPRHVQLARLSFTRALALDSTFALAIEHLLFVAYLEDDRAAVTQLMPLLLAYDSSGDRTGFYRWRSAVTLGDSAAAARSRAEFGSLPQDALRLLVAIPQGDGVGLSEAILADSILSSRSASAEARAEDRLRHGLLQLTLGRPGPSPIDLAGAPIVNGLFNDGHPDSASAAAARIRAAGPLRRPVVSHEDWVNRYALALWEVSQGRLGAARAILAELRSHRVRPEELAGAEDDPVVLPALLETWLAMAEHAPDAARRVAAFDSLMATGPQAFSQEETALLLGRWYRELHQPALALRALRRTPIDLLLPFTIAPRTLARARVAVTVGDTAEAIRSYQLYLALRRGPDARLVPQRDSARTELAGLVTH